jgi:hypothetical protein
MVIPNSSSAVNNNSLTLSPDIDKMVFGSQLESKRCTPYSDATQVIFKTLSKNIIISQERERRKSILSLKTQHWSRSSWETC